MSLSGKTCNNEVGHLKRETRAPRCKRQWALWRWRILFKSKALVDGGFEDFWILSINCRFQTTFLRIVDFENWDRIWECSMVLVREQQEWFTYRKLRFLKIYDSSIFRRGRMGTVCSSRLLKDPLPWCRWKLQAWWRKKILGPISKHTLLLLGAKKKESTASGLPRPWAHLQRKLGLGK